MQRYLRDTLVTLSFLTMGAESHPRRDALTAAGVRDEDVVDRLIIVANQIQSVWKTHYAEDGCSFPWDDMLSRQIGTWMISYFLGCRCFPSQTSSRLQIRQIAAQLEKEHGNAE